MKAVTIAVTFLSLVLAITFGAIAFKTNVARVKAEKERDQLASRFGKNEEERLSLQWEYVNLMGEMPDEVDGKPPKVPFTRENLDRFRTMLQRQNKSLDPPYSPNRVNAKNLLMEFMRQLATARQRAEEGKLQVETLENRLEEEEERNHRRKKEERDRFVEIYRLIEGMKKEREGGFWRQTTDLRERIKNLSADLEKVCEEKRRTEHELRCKVTRIEYDNRLFRRSFHIARPLLRKLLTNADPELRFQAAGALDVQRLLSPEDVDALRLALRSPSKPERTEATRFFMDRRRHAVVCEELRSAFFDSSLPPERRLEILKGLLERKFRPYGRLAFGWSKTLPPSERFTAAGLFGRYGHGFALPLLESVIDEGVGPLKTRAEERLKALLLKASVEGVGPTTALPEYGSEALHRMGHWVKLREKARTLPPPNACVGFRYGREAEWSLDETHTIRVRVLSPDPKVLALPKGGAPFESQLEEAAGAAGKVTAYRRGLYLVGTPAEIRAWDEKNSPWEILDIEEPVHHFQLALCLEEPEVSVDFMDTHIRDAADHLRRVLDLNILILDKTFERASEDELMVQLKVDDLSGREVMDLILRLKMLRYGIRWGCILWGGEWDLDHLYDIPALDREKGLPQARDWNTCIVSLALRNSTLQEAIRILGEKHGVQVTLSPELNRAVLDAPVELIVREVTAAQALHLLLVPKDLTLAAPEKGATPVVVKKK